MPTYLKPFVLLFYVVGITLLASGTPLLESFGFLMLFIAALGTFIWWAFG